MVFLCVCKFLMYCNATKSLIKKNDASIKSTCEDTYRKPVTFFCIGKINRNNVVGLAVH